LKLKCGRKGLTMTVKELINILLIYDANEKIQILDTENKEFKVDNFGLDPSLPYIVIKERG
jgi:hypothetical protein